MLPLSFAIMLSIVGLVLALITVLLHYNGFSRAYNVLAGVAAAIIMWYLSLSFVSGNFGETLPIVSQQNTSVNTLNESVTIITNTVTEIPYFEPSISALYGGAAVILTLIAIFNLVLLATEIFEDLN